MNLKPFTKPEGVWANLFGFYTYDLELVSAEGIWLTDSGGNRYIDCTGGPMVQSIAHGDQRIADAICEQLQRFAYAHPLFAARSRADYANEVASVMPDGLNATYIVCGGSEANESALKIAHQYHRVRGDSGRRKVVSPRDGYHGMTMATMAASGNTVLGEFFDGALPDGFAHFDQYSEYLCPDGLPDEAWALECAQRLEACIHNEGPGTVSAVMMAGHGLGPEYGLLAPPSYWQEIRRICDHYGVLLIFDEIVSGFGRTGHWFACQHGGITPDIITVAKGAVSGYLPLAAVTVSDGISTAIRASGPLKHAFTFSGHPVSCAAGAAVIRVIKEDGLVENSSRLGARFREHGKRLLDHPTVSDVRSSGLLMGMELTAAKRGSREFFPANRNAERVLQSVALDHGLALYGGLQGPDAPTARARGLALRLSPPLTIEDSELDEMMGRFDDTLTEWEAEMGVA